MITTATDPKSETAATASEKSTASSTTRPDNASYGTTVRAGEPQAWRCEPGAIRLLPEREYHELWFELRSWGWRSLAIIPTCEGVSEFDVAEKLVMVGVSNTGRPLTLLSAEGITVEQTEPTVDLIRRIERLGEQVIVVVDSLVDNPAAMPIVQAVNGSVLVVRLGESEQSVIERVVLAVGRERVLGVVTRGGKGARR